MLYSSAVARASATRPRDIPAVQRPVRAMRTPTCRRSIRFRKDAGRAAWVRCLATPAASSRPGLAPLY